MESRAEVVRLKNETDVLVVGAGPIGIELAVALKKAGIEYGHVDAGQIGSTISWYAPNTHFFSSPERISIAGVPLQTLDQTKATREEYLTYLRSVVLQFDLRIRTFERVVAIDRADDARFRVVTEARGESHEWLAKRVVLAIGDMHRPRRLGVPGENLPHVSHYFSDPHLYFRRKVLVVGGKNSAVEAAIRCVRVGAGVTLSCRGEELDPGVKPWLLPEVNAMIREKTIRFVPASVVCEIRPDVVVLEVPHPVGRVEIPADAVLLMTGYEQDPSLFEQAGVELEGAERRPRLDQRTMESSVPGLYVAGTAVAGTQAGAVKEFIETGHVHVDRILAALQGREITADAPRWETPES